MRAFIVRPFGKKKDLKGNEIDFNEVERVLIAPALKAVGAEGGTTIDIVESGNIRTDMFRRLLTADLVVADLSIHNANVFYELGIRHALREHGTFMLRCDSDAFPFDLQTDRYFVYKKDDPAAGLPDLITALRRTKDAQEKNFAAKDSPVFTSLPSLTEHDPSLFNPLPQDFGEEVAHATSNKVPGDLALLSYEMNGFEWEARGWHAVGVAQFDLNAMFGAKITWEKIRKLEPDHLEANIRLGTIYERLGDLVRSTEALEIALSNRAITQGQRAEAYSLMARNFKTRWRNDWEGQPPEGRAVAALRSPHLTDCFENYERAFDEDLNHFYSGLNALAMLKVMIALAEAWPDVWAANFDSDRKADQALDDHREHAAKLVAAIDLSVNAYTQRVKRGDSQDVWAEISAADLRCITTEAPLRVAAAYRKALADAPDFAAGSVRKQLAMYRDLGVLGANLPEVFKVVGEPPALPATADAPARRPPRPRVLLFAGHMIDAPDRENPRFPAAKEAVARAMIKKAVEQEMQREGGVAAGYAGGASGGDILFHEVCAELGIPTRLYLAIPPGEYVRKSVKKADQSSPRQDGRTWVESFWSLYNEHATRKQVREPLSDATDVPDGQEYFYLPAWLREKQDYSIWQRNNLWMLFNALDEACDPTSADPNITLIALWDGAAGDGPGGTGDLVDKVENLGARSVILDTKALLSDAPSGPGRKAEEAVAATEAKSPVEETDVFDVFLSYNRSDQAAVENVARQLLKHGIKPWFDKWQLRPGLPWQDELERQIANIKSVAVFLGKAGIGPWQDLEQDAFLREFRERRCPVIPVILPEGGGEPKLPIFLRGMTWVDFRRQDPDPLESLIWGVTGKRVPSKGEEE
jgi:hypothetical protein